MDDHGSERSDEALLAVLERARQEGFLGTGPVIDHVRHARALHGSIPGVAERFLDLGSGGGVPGLVVAWDRPDLRGILLDGSTRRGAFLRDAVAELGIESRMDVRVERAEDAGRRSDHRGIVDVVLSRSFGPPAVVAECAAPLLRVGGLLIVSDPPDSSATGDRWPASGLAELGLEVRKHHPGPPAFTVLRQVADCPARFPRRVGIPAKRPLF